MSGKSYSSVLSRVLVWLVPLLATLLLGGYGIGRAQLWRDELATWSAATRPIGDLLRLTRTIDAASGPYYLSVHAWTGLAGDSEAALRLPSVLAMAAAAGLTAVLGRRLFGSAAGLLAGLLFAVLPGTSRYAQEARPYALVTLLAVLATVLLVRALDRPGRWRWAGYAAAVAGLGLAHLLALGLVAAHAVAVLTGRPAADPARPGGTAEPGQPGGGTPGGRWRDRRSAGWALAVLVAALLLTPLLVTAAGQRSHQLDWIAPARPADLAALPGGLAQSGVVGGMLVGLAALGAARAGRRGLLPGAGALLPVLLLFVAALAVPLWVPRYLFFTVPFGCLLAGAALAGPTPAARPSPGPPGPLRPTPGPPGPPPGPVPTGPPPTGWRPAAGAGLAVVALAGLLGLPDQAAVRHGHGWPRSATVDYRGAAAVIAAGQRPGDAVVYAPRDGWLFLDLGVDYHLARTAGDPAGGVHPRDVLVTEGRRERADLWVGECARPAECLAGVDRVWLVVAGRRDDPLAAVPGARGEALRAGFSVDEVRPRPGVTVALLVRRG
ncbi:Dolichyl-phosphate-mannose-protein mannosyltransferase [Micromonospora rifamycinica]|uniref:Dolichyl-phosphate-mannose-protein mannosyltransferase n=3 Tax=Micromonospora rifamycinica TaxID=291594 RepID=A0A1C5KAK2_9ACTN|nr:glycosyltransferase family 39 protein [Micromonospora rifamycinica]SCG79757.1 Dolichyl-phosphate-mannose-protein mannosyltransferase [Micromonospora rifamycinica]